MLEGTGAKKQMPSKLCRARSPRGDRFPVWCITRIAACSTPAQYVAILIGHGVDPRMSRPANPYNYANCKSFIKNLKREEIYANEYAGLEHLSHHVEEFIERYYNRQRLASALSYCTPDEFEK
jgi:transposase InsO family protein